MRVQYSLCPPPYIPNSAHYTHVLEKARTVRRTLWIGTADIKDLYVKTGLKDSEPFLKVLSNLIKRGVEVRLVHAKEPGANFREDFDKYPMLKGEHKRNFEAGILTTEPALVESAINQFDEVWMGKFCDKCGRKAYCGDRIK